MSPVELLRAAAARARELDERATKAPWWVENDSDVVGSNEFGDLTVADCMNVSERLPEENNARYIAAFRAVAAPLAALFERIAWMGGLDADLLSRVGVDEALAVARALLGEDATDA